MRRSNPLRIQPIALKHAMTWVHEHHRHELTGKQRPVVGGGWAHSVVDEEGVIHGCAIVGRPVARYLDDGLTAEVTRLATDGHHNAASMLYGASRATAKAMGYKHLVTYILASEPGTSLRAAGWVKDTTVQGRQWDRPKRSREHVLVEDRVRWWGL